MNNIFFAPAVFSSENQNYARPGKEFPQQNKKSVRTRLRNKIGRIKRGRGVFSYFFSSSRFRPSNERRPGGKGIEEKKEPGGRTEEGEGGNE